MSDDSGKKKGSQKRNADRTHSLTVEIALEAHILRFLRDRGHHHLIEACKGTFSDVAFDRSLRLTHRLEELVNKHLMKVSIVSKKPLNNLITIGRSMQNFQRDRLSNPPAPGSACLESFQAFPNRAPPNGWYGSARQMRVRKAFDKYSRFTYAQNKKLTPAASQPMTQHSPYEQPPPEQPISQATSASDMVTDDITLEATQPAPMNLYDSDLDGFVDE
ncbi:peptidase M16 domain-containing protein [Perkinsela sp. CCAP 1560/4]|nr:peptidase M16 domain-containing protein [Perkinsela sp. CCAP 1560/4]|eukprot:KNH04182.1 peptidase M16 domain-containing protein [Perkinsela sp. CCAP 1560/4]